jgi:hypothetical protein
MARRTSTFVLLPLLLLLITVPVYSRTLVHAGRMIDASISRTPP